MRVLGFFIVIVAVILLAEAMNALGAAHPSAFIVGSFMPGSTALLIGLLFLHSRKRNPPSRTKAMQALLMPPQGGIQLSTYQYLPPELEAGMPTGTDRNAQAKRGPDAGKVMVGLLLCIFLMGINFVINPSVGAGIEILIVAVVGGIGVIAMEMKK
jgi:hypothetical protein